MITVGSRDARKVLGLGFGVEREMDDTELEEGEACSYRDDASVDPDVALSYIDEKIHNVLGHFQKDFEGGVSAENLGAKFGGYGSFLPSYQRSPVWSHPRTPPKIHHFNTPESPKSLQPEIGHHNSVVRTSAPLLGRHGPATTNNVTLPATKAPSVHDSSKRDMSVPHTPVEGFIPKSVVANKSAHPPEPKSLKVRIKVGSDNLSTQKNAAIYSGLGLDVSPSSSLEDSPTESEGLSRAPQESPEESPSSILQMMISFPVHGSILLSPLPDSLVSLTKKEKLLRGSSSDPVPEDGHVSSVVSANASDSGCGDWRVSGKKKTKATEFNGVSSELRNQNSKDAQSSIAVTLKKESDIDTLACEELVSNALKLPLMSTSYGTGGDPAKVAVRVSEISRDARKDTVKDEFFSDIIKEESLEQACKVEVGWVEKPTRKAGSAARVGGDREDDGISDVEVYQKRDGNRNGEKSYESGKADSDAFKGRSALNAEIIDPLKLKSDLKATSQEQNRVPLLPGKEHSSSGGKKKSKGSRSHNTLAAETPKESLRVSSSASKTKKSIPDENNTTKTESENLKLQKDSRKARDPYRDFFGDISLEQEENEEDSMDLPSKGRVKDPEVNETGRFASNNESNERLSEKRIEKPWTTEAYPKAVSNVAPFTGNGPISDAAPSLGPIDSKDNWVCCDKCQKWRLLPFGTNPDNLPEKWLCSMQKWLPPGMNRCSFSEDETTRALYALYQAPPSESQNNLRGHPDGNVLGVHQAGAGNPDQNKHNVSSRAVPNGVKKKHELKEMSDATNQVVPTEFPGFVKNIQPSVKSRSLNEVNQSPLVNEADLQQSKSSDLATEKQRNKKKEKHQSLEQYSDGGSMKNLKMKNERESDQDDFRTSKKTKKEVKMHTDDDWMSDIGGAIRKPDLSSTSGLPTDVVGKDQSNHTDRSSSKDSKCDRKDDFQVSAINLKEQVLGFLDNGDVRRQDNKDSIAKKRKVKECGDNQISSESLPSTEYDRQRSRVSSKEEESENDHRKEKKAKVPRYDGKESILSKGNGRTDKKGNLRKDQQLGQDLDCALAQRSLDGVDSFKRDLVSSQPVAATSSSSKVSGSHKSKTNFQEVKGSPVESVSSSPMRVSNTDKLRENLVGKEDPQDTGFFTRGSPRRYSDGEDDGGSDRSGTGREDKSFVVNNHRSVESTVLDFHDREFNHISVSKTKAQTVTSPEMANRHYMNGNADTSGQYMVELLALDRCHDEERRNDGHYYANGSSPRKSGKGSSSRLKDKNRGSRTEYDKHKSSDSFHASQAPPNEEKTKDGRNKFQEKSGVKPYKVEKKYADKRDSAGKFSSESSKRESQSKSVGHGNAGAKVGVTCSQDAMRTPKQNMLRGHDGEKSPKAFFSDKTDRAEVISVRGKSVPLPPSGRGQNDPQAREHRQVPVSHKGNGASTLPVDDASEGENAFKGPKQTRQVENETGGQKINLRHATPNGQRVRDLDAPSPVRKDSSSQAATNAVKEAKNLKHLADRLKNSGSNLESTGFYFQAALKFLYGASLLESSNSESSKHGEAYQSMQIYSSTAKLCEFCAHEFERSKDMAAASLAYKCMEVAYMRVTYFSHTGASRDRHELQTALQMVPPGESPSSSASDVDNLNNVAVDKVSLAKGVSSPQVAGNHVISARNRPNFVRLLNFAQDVNFAMEASRKSRMAFAAASITLEETQQTEGILSIKRALDFNFQDVEGLLQLVRIAMDAISH